MFTRFFSLLALLLLSSLLTIFCPIEAFSQCEADRLRNLNTQNNQEYGTSVAVDGNITVIGAPKFDGKGGAHLDSGAAFVFQFLNDSWQEIAMLTASDSQAGAQFGAAVAIAGDTIMIGSPQRDDQSISNRGAIYVFRSDSNSWQQQAVLLASDGTSTDEFGSAVAIDGNRAIIGAKARSRAYLFRHDGSVWQQVAGFRGSRANGSERFGQSVAISGEWMVVGAPLSNDSGPIGHGAAYIFRDLNNGTVEELHYLLPELPDGGQNFGWSVAIDGTLAAIGVPNDDPNQSNEGSVYALGYNGTSWDNLGRFSGTDQIGLGFGTALALEGNNMIIGTDDSSAYGGSAFIFGYDGTEWSSTRRIHPSQGLANDFFGRAVALAGNHIIVGAPQADLGSMGSNHGSAYSFLLDRQTYCVADLNCDESVNNFDIDPFVLALSNPDSYMQIYPHCDVNLADINGDQSVNNFDIDFFIERLAS